MADSPDPDAPSVPSSATPEPPVGGGSPPVVGSTQNIAWPRLARMDEPVFAKGSGEKVGPSPLVSLIIMQVCGVALLVGGYFVGQNYGPKARSNRAQNAAPTQTEFAYKAQRVGGERALDAANQALKAEKVHDLRAAHDIYEDMLKRQAPMPKAEYRLALLALHQGDLIEAETHLSRSIKAGDALGDSYLFRASLASMRGNYSDVSALLAAAVRAEPFSAKLYFCWGEALRREGKLPDAVQRLTQALDRPDTPAARSLYRFKLRLAKVMAGGDPTADMELDNALYRPAPGGDWFMLAAARELTRKDYTSAAEDLQKARSAMPADLYRAYAQDFFFQNRRARPELSALLAITPTEEPTENQPLQDPASWTAAEADPAVWPPFANED